MGRISALFAAAVAGTVGLGAANSLATNLDVKMTVDDQFILSLSPVDALAGATVGTGNSWPTTWSFSQPLVPGIAQYIHVQATDNGPPAMFIGDFDLSDTGFEFADGSQQLLSGSPLWQVSKTGFGANYSATTDLGVNGTGPWGNFTQIDSTARFVWADTPGNTVFFSALIVPTGIPEPATLGVVGVGVAGLLVRRRR